MKLLGGEVGVVLYGMDDMLAEDIMQSFQEEALRLQGIFNFFDPGSELSRLNRKRSISASPEILEVVRACIPYCELTGGEFDIARGKQILQRKQGREDIRSDCSFRDISISGSRMSISNDDAMIDLGGVAKGYIGDKLASFLKREGVEGAFLDMRGDLVFFGNQEETVLIQHPRKPSHTIHSFACSNLAVATTGDYRQFWGDFTRSHVINSKDIISVTAVAGTLLEADLVATSIFVSGTPNLDPFMDKRYYAISRDMKTLVSGRFP
jgi:thiamine biosynthesis lipoprotein